MSFVCLILSGLFHEADDVGGGAAEKPLNQRHLEAALLQRRRNFLLLCQLVNLSSSFSLHIYVSVSMLIISILIVMDILYWLVPRPHPVAGTRKSELQVALYVLLPAFCGNDGHR